MNPKAVLTGSVGLLLISLGIQSAFAASGLFPKMPPAPNVFVVNCLHDSQAAKQTAFALQGLINQSSAEVYVLSGGQHLEQLKDTQKPYEILNDLTRENAGLRNLFQKYGSRVKKMFIYDPGKDWTWYLALMSGAQQDGIPVTESLKDDLASEFNWKGDVEDLRDQWSNRIEAYDCALATLMPNCARHVVFEVSEKKRLSDYVVASKGFAFWLDPADPAERAETIKIFRTPGYGLGTSVMGYHGDGLNAIANPEGIGYVASDFYGNGSFWSSFPNKTYMQAPGRAVKAEPGKIYMSITWSDGDNIQFDQNSLYLFWHGRDRGTVPVATALSPTLQELNSPLLDWYYSHMTTNDELICGPAGAQFIYIDNFNSDLFPDWCRLTREWCSDAGFHSVRIWRCPNPSAKYEAYMKTCGFDGVFGEGGAIRRGYPPKLDTFGAGDEEKLFEQFTNAAQPNPHAPVFVSFTPIVQGFDKKGGGYSAIKRQVDRLEAAYPGRYVVLLPKDQFATIRAYYHLGQGP